MANKLYFDFKIYHSLTSFSQNCIYFASIFSFKAASFQYCMYRQIKCDIQLYKLNIGIGPSIFELELHIGMEL